MTTDHGHRIKSNSPLQVFMSFLALLELLGKPASFEHNNAEFDADFEIMN
jgi:hypothetical protein